MLNSAERENRFAPGMSNRDGGNHNQVGSMFPPPCGYPQIPMSGMYNGFPGQLTSPGSTMSAAQFLNLLHVGQNQQSQPPPILAAIAALQKTASHETSTTIPLSALQSLLSVVIQLQQQQQEQQLLPPAAQPKQQHFPQNFEGHSLRMDAQNPPTRTAAIDEPTNGATTVPVDLLQQVLSLASARTASVTPSTLASLQAQIQGLAQHSNSSDGMFMPHQHDQSVASNGGFQGNPSTNTPPQCNDASANTSSDNGDSEDLKLSSLVFTRRRAGQKTRPAHGPVIVSKSQVCKLFHLPIQDAAAKLGISMTALKNACRKIGVERWPYKKGQARKGAQDNASDQDHSIPKSGLVPGHVHAGGQMVHTPFFPQANGMAQFGAASFPWAEAMGFNPAVLAGNGGSYPPPNLNFGFTNRQALTNNGYPSMNAKAGSSL